MERVKGIEPSRPAWKAGALPLSYTRKIKNGRSSRIRTCDPLVPSQVRYQTALCPVIRYFAIIANPMIDVNHYCHREHHKTCISVTKFIISPTKKTDKYFYVKFYKFINKNRNRIATLRSYTISIIIIILITLES